MSTNKKTSASKKTSQKAGNRKETSGTALDRETLARELWVSHVYFDDEDGFITEEDDGHFDIPRLATGVKGSHHRIDKNDSVEVILTVKGAGAGGKIRIEATDGIVHKGVLKVMGGVERIVGKVIFPDGFKNGDQEEGTWIGTKGA